VQYIIVPTDNQTGTRLPAREDIRKIDGRSFYALLTNERDALDELYRELPTLVAKIINEEFGTQLNSNAVTSRKAFDYNFIRAYGRN